MAQSGKVWDKSKQPVEILKIEESGVSSYNSVDTVSIRSLIDAKVKLTGAVSGKVYIWERAGAVISVDVVDKDEVLNKKRGRACCGGTSGTALFQLE